MLLRSTVAARIRLWWCVLQSLCVMVHAGCAITPDSNGHVDIPSTWSEIPKDSFKECTLKTVNIPDSVTTIGNEAFRGCRSLTSVPIPDSATTIGHGLYGLMYANAIEPEKVASKKSRGRALSFLGERNEWENRTFILPSVTSMTVINNSTRDDIVNELLPARYKNEHIPLYLPEKNLLVCRTPKVGSLYLRSVFMAFRQSRNYTLLGNFPISPSHKITLTKSPTTMSILFGNATERLFFVRDPLTRTLAGYLEMAHHHASTEHFRNWTYSVFPRDYTDECNEEAVRKSLDSRRQHWTPAQFCRCGLEKFKVPFRIVKIEDVAPQTVLRSWFDDKYLGGVHPSDHTRSYNVSRYLTPDVTAHILNITARERQYFGYT